MNVFLWRDANNPLQLWKVAVTNEEGKVQNFGSYTQNQACVSGKTILDSNTQAIIKLL